MEQLCGHLEAADLRQHLVNPLLIKFLVAKLLDREKHEWVRYKRNRGDTTLRTFADFLMDIVVDACEANIDVEIISLHQSKKFSLSGKKPKEKGGLYSHSEATNPASAIGEEKRWRPCKLCRLTYPSSATLRRFQKAEIC